MFSFSLPRWGRALRLLGFALVVGFSLFYIVQVNQMIRDKYLIENYEQKIGLLTRENKNLEERLSQLSSLENIEMLIENLDYEKVDYVYYIRAGETRVVTK